jgi:hypothetical protein
MTEIDPNSTLAELIRLAADHHHKRVELTEEERSSLVSLIKQRAADELEYGQELVIDGVRLIHRVTGAVGLYFNSGD